MKVELRAVKEWRCIPLTICTASGCTIWGEMEGKEEGTESTQMRAHDERRRWIDPALTLPSLVSLHQISHRREPEQDATKDIGTDVLIASAK